MSEERSKGLSLRKKRTHRVKGGDARRKEISGPIPINSTATKSSSSSRPSQDTERAAAARKLEGGESRDRDHGRSHRSNRADKTAELVKRRYSQRITALPSDFGQGAPMPTIPQIPSQYRSNVPPSRGGEQRPGTSDGPRALHLDMESLQDPNLNPNQCQCLPTTTQIITSSVPSR